MVVGATTHVRLGAACVKLKDFLCAEYWSLYRLVHEVLYRMIDIYVLAYNSEFQFVTRLLWEKRSLLLCWNHHAWKCTSDRLFHVLYFVLLRSHSDIANSKQATIRSVFWPCKWILYYPYVRTCSSLCSPLMWSTAKSSMSAVLVCCHILKTR